MIVLALAALTFVSTSLGGLFALKHKDNMHRILGFAAGVIIGVVAFDLLPEIFDAYKNNSSIIWPMVALVAGFLIFHIVEKSILIHHSQENEYQVHHHPQVGVASALALIGHSFLDGVGIGLGFQINSAVGIAVTIAVIAHDFTDGLNTVSLMLVNKNTSKRSLVFLFFDAIAPLFGAAATMLFNLSNADISIYLGFFTGFLLYIGASEILPEAHSKHSSYVTIGLTILGATLIFVVTRFI